MDLYSKYYSPCEGMFLENSSYEIFISLLEENNKMIVNFDKIEWITEKNKISSYLSAMKQALI